NKIEQMFALGGLVLKGYVDKKEDDQGKITYKLKINYVIPDCFIPLSYENDEITEGALLNIIKKKDKIYCLFEFHEWKILDTKEGLKKVYLIRNELYESEKNNERSVKKVPLNILYDDLEEEVAIEGLTQPLFRY